MIDVIQLESNTWYKLVNIANCLRVGNLQGTCGWNYINLDYGSVGSKKCFIVRCCSRCLWLGHSCCSSTCVMAWCVRAVLPDLLLIYFSFSAASMGLRAHLRGALLLGREQAGVYDQDSTFAQGSVCLWRRTGRKVRYG